MIIQNIVLKDFRCFFGENRIEFSEDSEKNITLVHAENGVGKTTLLNAFLWCFYERTTSRFERKDQLLNLDSLARGSTSGFVEVQFRHAGSSYRARRTISHIGEASVAGDLRVVRLDEGAEVPLSTSDTFINQIMPRDMAQHFLFDGEAPEIFMAEDNRSSVRQSVQNILGCTLITTAIDDLDDAIKYYRRSMPKSKNETSGVSLINAQVEAIEVDIAKKANEKDNLTADIAAIEDQLAAIREHLKNTAGAKGLEEQRVRYESELNKSLKTRSRKENEVLQWIGESAIAVASKERCAGILKEVEAARERGRVPEPYNKELVDDIIKDKVCICGRPLEAHTPEYSKVFGMLDKATDAALRSRLSRISGTCGVLKNKGENAPRGLLQLQSELTELDRSIASYEQELGQISLKLQGIDLEDVSKRERKRKELEGEKDDKNRIVGRLEQEIFTLKNEKQQVEKRLNAAASDDLVSQKYLKKIFVCNQLKDALKAGLEEEERRARSVLKAKVSNLLEQTTKKSFQLSMTNDYSISLVDVHSNQLPRSSGENQLLGLAFTAALVEFAKDRKNADSSTLLRGTVAPLVLDSPLGSLDSNYRLAVVEMIPKMAGQVVLLLSGSQGSPEVLDAITDKVGAEYVLARRNTDKATGKGESKVIRGKMIETATFGDEYNGTEIIGIYQ